MSEPISLFVPRYTDDDVEVIGLPVKAMTISNSERAVSACPRKWLFAYGDGITNSRSRPLRFGSAVHEFAEDVHLWWATHDTEYLGDGMACVWCESGCEKCGGTGDGPVTRSGSQWLTAVHQDDYPDEEKIEAAKADADALYWACNGWLEVYGSTPDPMFRMVAPELRLAVPIRTPAGKIYRPVMRLAEETGTLRPARPGEPFTTVRWPWYQVLTVDGLLQHRETGDVYIYELKTSRAPAQRMLSMHLDPQVPTYFAAVSELVAAGKLKQYGIKPTDKVAGYHYDVVSSSPQKSPHVLKPTKVKKLDESGEPMKTGSRWVYELDEDGAPIVRSPGLSIAGSVTSWRFREAIKANGFNEADYEDHLMKLMSQVDSRLYIREHGLLDSSIVKRARLEMFATAKRVSAHRRAFSGLTCESDRDLAFPRVPVCISSTTGCAFASACVNDGEAVREEFLNSDLVHWKLKEEEKEVFEW